MGFVKLNERIAAWLAHVGMSVSTLAKRVGVAWESAYQWTTGKTQPTHENLAAIVEVLGISLPQFWGPVPSAPPAKRKAVKRRTA